jgi:acylphosphatase
MAMQRGTFVFRGDVQGVGFRYTACRAAAGFAVTGWVRNERDGTVRLVAEGDRAQVEAFVEEVKKRMAGHIDAVSATWATATGEFRTFSIRY